jgi:hypothetical protein
MSWFSDEHKKIYSQALGALYEDVKSCTNAVVDGTGKLISTSYEKIRDGVIYLDKKYNTEDLEETSNNQVKNINDSDIDIDISEDTDDYIVEMGKMFPDILIKLNKNHTYIAKIWVIENNGTLKPVRGKIESYQYINKLIHKWFAYETKNSRGYKWYPTNELYTAYRNSSNRLTPIDDIIFRYTEQGYKPFHYHPLF